MNKGILRDILKCINIGADILVFGQGQEEHDQSSRALERKESLSIRTRENSIKTDVCITELSSLKKGPPRIRRK